MTKLAPEWVQTSDPVIRSPARYHWTTAPASVLRPKTCADYYESGYYDTNFVMDRTRGGAERLQIMFTVTSSRAVMDLGCGLAYPKMKVISQVPGLMFFPLLAEVTCSQEGSDVDVVLVSGGLS